MANNWRIYGKDTIACKLSKAELPGFFQKKIVVGPQEAALIVKNGRIQETVTQKSETVLGFWERVKSMFGANTDVDVFIVDTTPVDLVIYLGKTDKGARSTTTGQVGPTGIQATLISRTDAGARAAGIKVEGSQYSETPVEKMAVDRQEQRDVSDITILALSSDQEVISAECRLRISVSLEDVRLLTNALRGRAALSTWDLTALIKDELLAKVLLPRIGQLRSEELRGNRGLLSTIENDVSKELLPTFSSWGLTLVNFVINWGLTELDINDIDRKRQTRQEDALKFTHQRQLADMQRHLEIDVAHLDNLRQLKVADAKGDEALKALYVSSEVERANIMDGERLNKAKIDSQIALLQLDITIQQKEMEYNLHKRGEDDDWDRMTRAFIEVQKAKLERMKLEQNSKLEQTRMQTDAIERLTSKAIEKGAAGGSTIEAVAHEFTMQKAVDRSDAIVDSLSKAEAAKANVNTFKDAEDRERKHQVDMTGQAANLMESSKQGVPHTLVQGGGGQPNVHVSVSSEQQDSQLTCPKCKAPIKSNWKWCPTCGESLSQTNAKCSCGGLLEAGWKLCPQCGKAIS